MMCLLIIFIYICDNKMQTSCKAPKCEFSKRWGKCVKPNPYSETLAWCKRNKIEHNKCKSIYDGDKELAKKEACNRYGEKVKQRKQKSASAKTVKGHVFLKDVYDTPPNKLNTDIKSFMQKRAATTISRFIKNTVLRRTETLKNRLNYYTSIQYHLKNVQYENCLVPKRFKDAEGNINDGFELDSTLKLIKRIGSRSAYGAVYQTASRNTILSVASKLMPANNKNKQEVILNTTTTFLVRRNLTRHFLISYKTFKCSKKLSSIVLPPVIRNHEYYISMNELAHGDLKQLCFQTKFLLNDELMINTAIQCFLAIHTFHMLNYSHNDCHWGNILYQVSKNTDGYFHYKIHDKDYYLKNCGYTFMLYDFGLAKNQKTTGHNRRLLEDYRLILQYFIKYSDGGILDFGDSVPHAVISNYMSSINHLLFDIIANKDSEVIGFEQYILPKLLKSPISGIFIENINGQNIINKTPFIIDDTISIRPINPFMSPLQSP